jgi:hypothetical protein
MVPVICNSALTNNTRRFSVGGYVSRSGTEIQTTSNLAAARHTAGAVTVGTNPMVPRTPISTHGVPAFFKVRTSEP